MIQRSPQRINPFNELYVTETIGPLQFVSLFSPAIVEQASGLFLPGNVVVRGVQGSGKSMLLSLLKTEIRLAYKQSGADLPIADQLRNFIGAGINISTSGALDFGQRPIEEDADEDIERLPIYFGDFFNYWIVADILLSIHRLDSECEGALGRELGISTAPEHVAEFVRLVCNDPCWFGYLKGVASLSELRRKAEERIVTYRSFLNYNIESLPDTIKASKTTVGEPISRLVDHLRAAGVVPSGVQFFVQIDQYEELARLKGWRTEKGEEHQPGRQYRQLINKALAWRDSRVYYRIGSRLHAWNEDLSVFGSNAQLEHERNYKIIDLDKILRRGENVKWVFPRFARDVFERRVKNCGFVKLGNNEDQFNKFLGKGLSVDDAARGYARSSRDRVVASDTKFPAQLQSWLMELAKTDPLEAKLGEAWFLQKGWHSFDIAGLSRPFPWDKSYWRKERVRLALMHIAARNRQRMVWSGEDDVLSLSGSNILVFVSLCQHIWAAWLRHARTLEPYALADVPRVEPGIQAVGIQMASTQWYYKIPEQSGKSGQRQRFIDVLGTYFRSSLLDDDRMSYPGHNGFSLKNEDLEQNPVVKAFIQEAVDFGDLVEVPHTTKMQDRSPRTKWYLNPILSPHFQIPDTHVKEPMYVYTSDVQEWMVRARLLEAPRTDGQASQRSRASASATIKAQQPSKAPDQMTLDGFGPGGEPGHE